MHSALLRLRSGLEILKAGAQVDVVLLLGIVILVAPRPVIADRISKDLKKPELRTTWKHSLYGTGLDLRDRYC